MLVENEGLDQWYIPFFVVLGLVLVGVGVGLFLSLRSRYKLRNKHYVEHFNPLYLALTLKLKKMHNRQNQAKVHVSRPSLRY